MNAEDALEWVNDQEKGKLERERGNTNLESALTFNSYENRTFLTFGVLGVDGQVGTSHNSQHDFTLLE